MFVSWARDQSRVQGLVDQGLMDMRCCRNLMAKDDFKNLGFPDEGLESKVAEKKENGKEGDADANKHKNELRW